MAKDSIRIACAQINPTVGALEANKDCILRTIEIAKALGVDIISFPELCLTGYPPEDLLFKPQFVQDNLVKIQEIASTVKDIFAIVGFVDRKGRNIFNALALIAEGRIQAVYHKMILPNFGVFDEERYFKEGDKPMVFCLKGKKSDALIGLAICEDAWHAKGPVQDEAALGAQIVLVSNASPFHAGKRREREAVIRKQARTNAVTICYVNLVGGQDELVFDGQSMVVDNRGRVTKRGQAFIEDLLIEDIPVAPGKVKIAASVPRIAGDFDTKIKDKLPRRVIEPPAETEEVYHALVLGLKDYVSKNGFKKVVVGLSGGIDSSLVATLAVDALGRDNCIGVFMPSRYSSKDSETDAAILAKNLGIEFKNVSIEHIYRMYLLILETHFVGTQRNVTEENLQARIRGNLLMAFSNKFGWLVLTTGNKSEMSCGYATLYGDMAGGFAVIKDVPKTLVYKLCRYRNSLKNIIPERVFAKAPTAELRPNQKDSDSLPEYGVLDPILKAYVELDRSVPEIAAAGFDEQTVRRVAALVDSSEYKRRQAAPGIKITPRAFGRDRRMPITNRYRR
ncbi:MAG: NAD+ synthase [Candidatus Omnitrophica bacterium]|nr:NAD+ synthase [Candidatus Omnitrophota bacterium]